MKKHFITGLIILLPLAVTIIVIIFILNFLTAPFVGILEEYFMDLPGIEKYHALLHFALQIFTLVAFFFFTVLLGFLTRIIIFKYLIGIWDYILHRIPIIKTIYKASQQVIQTILGTTSRSFKQVVMVPFPVDGAYALGLVSSPPPALCETTVGEKLITVFVPTTPNPTSGYLMMYKEKEVVYLDMKIDEAFKYIISCGVISNPDEIPGKLQV